MNSSKPRGRLWTRAAELARLARGVGLDTLGYLLDMAHAEARRVLGTADSIDWP